MCHAFYFWVVKRRTRRESSMISIPALRSNAKLERVRWGHCLRWKETLRTDTCLRSADDWPHQQLLITNISSKIWRYVKDLWNRFMKDSDPPQGLAFWLWLYWAWGSLERSSTVQWNWCAVLTALERLWMKWKLMKHHDSNHDSQVKIQSQ